MDFHWLGYLLLFVVIFADKTQKDSSNQAIMSQQSQVFDKIPAIRSSSRGGGGYGTRVSGGSSRRGRPRRGGRGKGGFGSRRGVDVSLEASKVPMGMLSRCLSC